MTAKSMGEKIRDSISFLSFMGDQINVDIMIEVRASFKSFVETGSCLEMNKTAWKIDNRMAPIKDFSFIRTNQLKLICAILLFIYSRFYKSRTNKHSDTIFKLIDMMIGEATRDEVDGIITQLNLEYYHDIETMRYCVEINKILEMTPDEFAIATMDDLGFD